MAEDLSIRQGQQAITKRCYGASGSRARQKHLNYRTQSLQPGRLLCRANTRYERSQQGESAGHLNATVRSELAEPFAHDLMRCQHIAVDGRHEAR
jgi:hypothetical protein